MAIIYEEIQENEKECNFNRVRRRNLMHVSIADLAGPGIFLSMLDLYACSAISGRLAGECWPSPPPLTDSRSQRPEPPTQSQTFRKKRENAADVWIPMLKPPLDGVALQIDRILFIHVLAKLRCTKAFFR